MKKFLQSQSQFQSTQPEWAATQIVKFALAYHRFQSTQPEWAATDIAVPVQEYVNIISIHAARVGCD